MNRKLILSLFLFSMGFNMLSQVTRVGSQAELNNALAIAQAGDTIEISRSGSPYTGLEIVFKGNGTAERPVVIMAERTGEVMLTGNSMVRIGGSYVYFEGFTFGGESPPDGLVGNGVIEFRSGTGSSDWCHNCRIKNVEFNGHNQSAAHREEILKWVRVYGQDNEVAWCTFNNKYGLGNCITVERNDAVENRSLIHHNYFANRLPVMNGTSVLNDQDAIRLGYSGTSLTDASCRVYNNFFYNWDGEPEIISGKSGNNRYYNNTFTRCVGTLTLRHGTHGEVYGNYFFGENIPKSGGVRVIDSDHRIYNNYFQDLNTGGSKVTGAINLFKGDADFVIDGILSSYAICEDVLVASNTIVNCDKGIWIGPDDSGREYAPKNLEIVNNMMIDCTEAVLAGTEPGGVNIFMGNIKKGGSWWPAFSNADNLETANDLTAGDGRFERITALSEAVGFAVPLSDFEINKDILGGDRDSEPDSGAEEYNSNGQALPYSPEDVGVNVGVVASPATGISDRHTVLNNKLKLFPNPGEDTICLAGMDPGANRISIYNYAGNLVKIFHGDAAGTVELGIADLDPGIYLLHVLNERMGSLSGIFVKK